MTSSEADIIVMGAGPAGVLAALRSAELVPFAQAAMAYSREAIRRRGPGKTVVTLIPPS